MDSPFAGLRMTKLITCKALVLLLLVCIVSLTDSTPSFGFDSANSCSPNGKMSRRGRAQMLAAIPCDLAKQPFCHLPGSIYPWHAVRRFVHENQGLMKRMYGDVRHISILRDEIQNNEVVDSDDIEEAAERYSKTPRGAKFMLHERDEFSNFKGNDVLMEPHFRPMSTTTSTTSTTSSTSTTTTTTTPTPERSTTSTASTSSSSSSSSTTTTVPPPAVAVAQPERESEQEQVELDVANSVYEVLPGTTASTGGSTSATRASVGDNIQIIESPELGSLPASPGTLRNLTIANVAKPTAAPATKRPTTTMPVRKQRPNEAATPPTPAKLSTNGTTMSGGISGASSTTIALLPRRNVTKSTLGSTTPVSFASLFSSTYTALGADKLRRPLLSHSTTTTTTSTTTSTTPVPVSTTTKPGLLREGGQLFQDAMKQEPMTVTSNMRGVNACPVKDEVVAPFWANNTRGEVLALLNLYPFEQYVHWEKCTHEFKQMFCRDGCRCEQQYRLHRLLAYDPHNECRGIFSDWFRFPSSCICKCYNIPMDFRATSRSPRSESGFDAPQSPAQSPPPPASLVSDPIGAAEAVVQRAIYEHATDQWYRPRDEYDFFEG